MAIKESIEISAVDKTKAAMKSAQDNLRNVQSSVTGVVSVVASLAGVAGFGALIKSTIDTNDKIQKLSIRLGASTEALSELRHVANLSDVSFETLTEGMQRMTRRIAEAAQGSGEAKGALAELGLQATALAQRKPEEQFEILAQALSEVQNQSDKVRLAMKLFDSEGVSLLQTMEQGAAGIRDMRNEAHDLGLTLSREAADSAAKAKDEMTRLQASIQGFVNKIVVEYGPAVADFLDTLSGAASNTPDALKNELFDAQDLLDEALKLQEMQKKIIAATPANDESNSATSKWFGLFSKTNNEVLKETNAELAQTEGTITAITNRIMEIQSQLEARKAQAASSVIPEDVIIKKQKAQAEQDQKEVERYRAKLGMQLESLQTYLADEQTRENEAYFSRQVMLDEALQNKLISQQRHQELLEGLTTKHEENLLKIQEKSQSAQYQLWQQGWQGKLQVTSGILGQLSNLMQSSSKQQFEIGKKAAIAQTVVDTYSMAVKSYNALAGIPIVGPALGAAAASAAILYGKAQIDRINAQQFGDASGAVGTYAANPNTGLPTGSGDTGAGDTGGLSGDTATQQPQRVVNITLSGTSYTREQVRDLIESINRESGDGVELQANVT